MPVTEISPLATPPTPPSCPTCGKAMTLTGIAPNCESTVYDYLCSKDGDRLSWRPHHQVKRRLAHGRSDADQGQRQPERW
jgi:tRNA(Ile2) C34 agmatinyltransferase TiaS